MSRSIRSKSLTLKNPWRLICNRKHLLIGRLGERVAELYLRRKKYIVLERNWRSHYGEADLICDHNKEIVCVEVKTRRAGSCIPGVYSVDKAKLERLMSTVESFMENRKASSRKVSRQNYRIDVVEVYYKLPFSIRIEHLESIEL